MLTLSPLLPTNEGPVYCLAIRKYSSSFNKRSQDSHFCLSASGSGSSQSIMDVDESIWRKSNLPPISAGDANPKGSYRLLIVDKTPRRVYGLTSVETLKVNSSSSESHKALSFSALVGLMTQNRDL